MKCAYEDCQEEGTVLTLGRNDEHNKPAYYCEYHSDVVVDEQCPEYCK